jgi:hypothetical protein
MRKESKKLNFKHETIRTLDNNELGRVAGGYTWHRIRQLVYKCGGGPATTAINCTQPPPPATTAPNCTMDPGPATTAITCN